MESFVERELKLDPPDDFVLPALDGDPLETRVFTSTYHDTPTRSLARAGITLRRRVEHGLSTWQLKLPRDEGRAEIAAPGSPAGPPPELRALLVAHLRHGELEPVATLRTRRSGVRVGGATHPVADVTVDAVDVLDGMKAVDGFAEVEVELVDGKGSDLEKLGRILRKAGARRSNGRAKVLRVLKIPEVEPPPEEATTLEQLRFVLALQLRELERYDPGVRLGDEPEDLHRFRVATRRSRAMIRATKPLLGETLAALGAELKWLTGVLGPVRDFDVLLLRLRAQVQTLGVDSPGGGTVVAMLEEKRERLNDAMLEALGDDRYLRLLDSFAAAIDSLPDLDADLRPIASKQLRRLRKASRRLGDHPSDEELHALRIRAKRARYSAELVAVADSGKPLGRYLEALKALQDVIGEHQDAVVAEAELRSVARAKTALAAGRLIERESQRRRERRRVYPEAVAKVLDLGRRADLI